MRVPAFLIIPKDDEINFIILNRPTIVFTSFFNSFFFYFKNSVKSDIYQSNLNTFAFVRCHSTGDMHYGKNTEIFRSVTENHNICGTKLKLVEIQNVSCKVSTLSSLKRSETLRKPELTLVSVLQIFARRVLISLKNLRKRMINLLRHMSF